MKLSKPLLSLALFFVSPSVFAMTVTSQAIKAGATISADQVLNNADLGCSGKNISPDIQWKGAPAGTKSFAVTLFDPDAPTEGSGWWHWTVFNIPADATSLPAGVSVMGESRLPNGAVLGRTDFGVPGYGGPCPPAGDAPHRYILRVYALKGTLPLDSNASGALIGFYIHNLKITEASIEAKFGR